MTENSPQISQIPQSAFRFPRGPSASCLALIRHNEGFRRFAYKDSGGYSIGYGHHGVSRFAICSMAQAEDWLLEDASNVVAGIFRCFSPRMLTQGIVDALADFGYNLGIAAVESSTLARLLDAGDYRGAWMQFPRWCHVGGQVSPNLLARRRIEQVVFLGMDWRPYVAAQQALPTYDRFAPIDWPQGWSLSGEGVSASAGQAPTRLPELTSPAMHAETEGGSTAGLPRPAAPSVPPDKGSESGVGIRESGVGGQKAGGSGQEEKA